MPYAVSVKDFDAIEGEWQELLTSCPAGGIFVTPQFQRVWWRHFGGDSQLAVSSVRDGDRLLGIAPLMLRGDVLSFVGGSDLFDYRDFVVRGGEESAFFAGLWDHLVDLPWSMMELGELPEGSPTLEHLPPLADGSGMKVEVSEEEATPVAALPASWDEYLGGLRKKDRHEVRRKLRRLESAEAPNQYICDNPETLESCMQDFFRLLRASKPEKDEFMTPARERFFVDIALELAPKGQFKLYFLEIGGVRVASCICLDYCDEYLLYNSGYDPDYSALSVGLLNKVLCIREAIEEGRHSFNFLKGTERYKYHLGGKSQPVHRLVVRR